MRLRTLALVLSIAARARAQTDAELAQALFDEALTHMDKGDYVRACPLLERSQKLDPGGGTLLNLGICYEGEKRLARAHTTLSEALSLARKDGRHDREQIALAHIDAIAPRLSRLRVSIDHDIDRVIVELDGVVHGPEIFGVLTPVDAGHHSVRVSAEGRAPWEWGGEIAEGESKEITATLALPRAAPRARTETRVSTTSWVLFGIGGASLGATIITGALALDAKSALDANCISDRGYCADPMKGASDRDRMQALAWTSTIALSVAITAAILGLAWPRDATQRSVALRF